MTTKIHYGRQCTLLYEWEGRARFYGARAASVTTRARRLAADPRATNIRIRVGGPGGREYQPDDIEIVRNQEGR